MATFESRGLARLKAQIVASGAAGRRNNPVMGVLWVTLAVACFAALGGFAKALLAHGLHPLEIVFLRNATCLLLLLPLLWLRGRSLVQSRRPGLYVPRTLLSFVSMMAWFGAVSMIPLSELTAISFLAPLFGTLFAILYLGEVVRGRRWAALIVGFLGAMIILRPGAASLGTGVLLAMLAALTSGMIGPLLKQLTVDDDADRIVFISTLLLLPLSLVPALFVWQWPTPAMLPTIAGIGLCAVIGHIALMRGFASTDASLVFTFEFSRLPFAAVIGWVFFGEGTDFMTWVGAAIIFASAVYVTRREAQIARLEGSVRVRDGAQADPIALSPVRWPPSAT